MKKIILVLFLIVSGITMAQEFTLVNADNQSHIGDLVGGDNIYKTSIKFNDGGTEREWFYKSWTTGISSLNTYQKFSQVYEKINDTFVTIPMSGLNVLSHGDATFGYLNDDDLPDLIQTGLNENGDSYTYVYMNNVNSSWVLSQTLFGVSFSSVSVIPNDLGDGVLLMGKNNQSNTYITRIFKNDHQGSGHLDLIYDGPGGIGGSTHAVSVMETNNFVLNAHGTNNLGQSFNVKIEEQSDGSFDQISNGLPTLEDGTSIYYDFDQDGDCDWYAVGTVKSFPGAPRLFLLYLNDGSNNFTEHQRLPVGGNMKMELADTDGDGYKESFIAMGYAWNGVENYVTGFSKVDNKFVEWENNPFNSESTLPSWFGNGFTNGFIIVTDMNNDGKDDVIIGGRTTHTGFGWGNYKAQLYLNTTTSLSVTDHILSKEASVYPNPTSNNITINLPQNTTLQKATVLDVTGRKVATIFKNNIINTSSFTNGVYVLKFVTKDGRTGVKKFIKN